MKDAGAGVDAEWMKNLEDELGKLRMEFIRFRDEIVNTMKNF